MSTPPAPYPCLRWRQLRPSTKLCLLAMLLVLGTGVLELGARVYWPACHGTHGTSAEAIWRSWYEELPDCGIDCVAPYHGDAGFDVLLLGGSVVAPLPMFGNIPDRLGPALKAKLGREVRVVACAYPGRTSLDSRLKYEHFADKRWDIVLVYHGINDVYLNNCPPGSFRPDYSHAYRRYGMQYDLARHPEVGYFALPYTASFLTQSLLERWNLRASPRGEFAKYGNDIRTPPSFEANLDAIASAAEQRGDPLVLCTFAYYLPADYTPEAFRAGRLDYTPPGCPVHTWGEPPNVARTIDLHNEAVRRVAMRHGLQLIDQRANLPDGKRHYHDCCHLTDDGAARWVENVVDGLDLSKVGRDGRR